MWVSQPVGDRGDELGFARAVQEIVTPLLAEFGFGVVDASSRDVWFESEGLWAVVFHEERSDAIGFHFNLLERAVGDGAFSVPDAMRLVDAVAAAQAVEPIARTTAAVRLALEGLKRDIETYCADALRGDAEVFAVMTHNSEVYLRQYSEWTRRSQEMGRGAAIERGDWARVVEIYESAEQTLDSLQERDFLMARQNVRTLRYCDPEWCDEQSLRAELARAYDSYGHFDGTADERDRVERAVGEAMDAQDWKRVIELYESASYDQDYADRTRLEIARRQLG